MIADPDDAGLIEQAALRLLAAREHGAAELRRKLLARGAGEAALDRVLEGLAARGLLSEGRFVAAYVEGRIAKGFGPVRIRAELRERGVDQALAEAGLPADDADWLPHLARTHDRKFGAGPPADRADWARRARFLEYRGFTTAQVTRFLSDHHHEL